MNTFELVCLFFMVSIIALFLWYVITRISDGYAVSKLSQMEDGIQKFLKPLGYRMYKIVPPDRASASEIQFTTVPDAKAGLPARVFLRLFMKAYTERQRPYREGYRPFGLTHRLNEECQDVNSEFLARRVFLQS
jgi:hypothetical protein